MAAWGMLVVAALTLATGSPTLALSFAPHNGAFENDKKDFALSRALLQSSCEPYSEAACKDAATALQLSLGSGEHAFAADYGSNYPRGCIGFSSGDFEGTAFFSLGGTEAENSADVSDPYYRPANYDCSGVEYAFKTSGSSCSTHSGCSALQMYLQLRNSSPYYNSYRASHRPPLHLIPNNYSPAKPNLGAILYTTVRV
ncbi:hypothetical protein CYMTET_28818 [Cymbomonas tetramitiformis]|uniref:Uncharacterized protein n=1 Tax=Cymbomonas tetramitiformis TaxID=36881 RepID=A0AAE0KVT2_9CHLO|nr:hypothetical protein CYMTET_28818 [Cymbomonas tetramitiformis]